MLTDMKNVNPEFSNSTDLLSLGDPEESLPLLLATCVKCIRDSLNTRFLTAGSSITSEQWGVLAVLAQQDGISQQDLAKRISRTEVSVLNLLKKLEAKDYVLRQRDPVDGRYNRVFLTVAGRRIQEELIPVVLENRSRAFKGLEKEEIATLKKILKKMIENTNNTQ